ncbi:MAG: ABC transporter substrate-binding protein [Chloroflexota bacterium]|nr:ABC transporter substrate-binding protein [Chloroflexota bacterium]
MLAIDYLQNRRRRVLLRAAVVLFLLIAIGCSIGTPLQPSPVAGISTSMGTPPLPILLTPPPGGLGTAANPIVISTEYTSFFYPEILSQWQEWAKRLEETTGLKFILKAGPPTELELLDAMHGGKVHLAFLNPVTYIYGYERGWVVPAASALATWNGQDARRIMFIARTDTDLHPGEPPRVFEQLNDKHPCYRKLYPQLPGLAPLEEYIIPSGLLALNSITTAPPIYIGEDAGFNSVEVGVFSKGCDFAAVEAVSPNEYKNMLPGELPNSIFPRWSREMQILYTTPPINPLGVIAISSNVHQSLQTQISHAVLLNSAFDIETKLVDFNESLYAEFERIVTASGVHIDRYLSIPLSTPEPAISNEWVAPPKGTLVVDVPLQGGAPYLPFMNDQPLNRLMIPAIYAELARLDAHGNFFPYLATDIPTLENSLARFIGRDEDQQFEVEFRLPSNLTWQDGYPLTSDDLVFSWNLVMDPGWLGSHWGQGRYAPEIYVTLVEAPAPDRIVFRFMSQRQAQKAFQSGGRIGDPSLYLDLAKQHGPVVPLDYMDVGRNVFPKHLLINVAPQDVPTSEFAQKPVYAGAYRLIEGGEVNKPVILEAFDNFALGSPTIQRIVFGTSYYSAGAVPDLQPTDLFVQALQARAIQIQLGSPGIRSRQGEDPAAYDALAAQGLASVTWMPRTSWEVLDFNLDNPHLADLKVRQAIAYAIDRQAIIDQVLAGHGELMRSYLPAWHPLYAGDEMLPDYAYDPNQARTLLKEAGYDLSKYPAMHSTRGALTLRLASMDVNLYPRPPIADIIKEQLSKVGIQVEVQFYSWPDFEGQDCSAIRNGRKFDLGMAGWGGSVVMYPIEWLEQATAIDSIPTEENGCPYEKSNWSGWRNAHAEAIRVQLADGQLALEHPTEYMQLWATHQLLWSTDLPSLPLFNSERPVVVASSLTNVKPSPFAFSGVEDTWNIFDWIMK